MLSPSTFAALADALETDWRSQARPEQIAPEGDYFGWLILAGRGWGKTRTGAEWILEKKRSGCRMMGLVGATAGDIRDVMIRGPAGILTCAPDWDRPEYEPSNRCLTWANGATALLYSAEEPNRLRGPSLEALWSDELAAYFDPLGVWEQIEYVMRIGHPQVVITTTPRPLPIIKDLMARSDFRVTRGSTYDNRANLAESFFRNVIARNEGTRLGKQEIYAEILEDTPGALWNAAMIEKSRVAVAPTLSRVVVSVDPAVTSGATSDLTGIVAVGLGADDGQAYVLADVSGRFSPLEWALKAVALYWKLGASRIVAETNMGGDMIEASLRNVDPNVSYEGIPARVGKIGRAEPVAAVYEQGRCHHVGLFAELEAEMCSYTPGSKKSPDRMDALVHGVAELMLGMSTFGMLDYMREEAAAMKAGESDGPDFGYSFGGSAAKGLASRFIAPPGCTTVLLLSGTSISPDRDGIVECRGEDANALRAQGWREPATIEGEVLP